MSEKTIRVRIRVGVGARGVWHACGWPHARVEDMEEPARALLNAPILWCWVEADVPMPSSDEPAINGQVIDVDPAAIRALPVEGGGDE